MQMSSISFMNCNKESKHVSSVLRFYKIKLCVARVTQILRNTIHISIIKIIARASALTPFLRPRKYSVHVKQHFRIVSGTKILINHALDAISAMSKGMLRTRILPSFTISQTQAMVQSAKRKSK